MDAGQTKVAQMGVNAAALAKLNGAITELGGKEVIQQGGGFSEKTEEKRTSRAELEDLAKKPIAPRLRSPRNRASPRSWIASACRTAAATSCSRPA